MDFERLLRAYIRHVARTEGTDFLPEWVKDDLVREGLENDEAERLIAIGWEEFDNRNKVA